MNKKIKIIELLNKIANGEEVPNKIKIFGIVFVWFEGSYRKEDANLEYITDYCRLDCMLNDEVEILEDNTEKQENLVESWKEVGKRVGEWAKEFEQGFKESFNEIVRYPFEKLQDNTKEIEELKYDVVDENGRGWYKLDTIADKVTELVKAVNEIRKDLNK